MALTFAEINFADHQVYLLSTVVLEASCKLYIACGRRWDISVKKDEAVWATLGHFFVFAFTNFQAVNNSMSSGDDEENCVHN